MKPRPTTALALVLSLLGCLTSLAQTPWETPQYIGDNLLGLAREGVAIAGGYSFSIGAAPVPITVNGMPDRARYAATLYRRDPTGTVMTIDEYQPDPAKSYYYTHLVFGPGSSDGFLAGTEVSYVTVAPGMVVPQPKWFVRRFNRDTLTTVGAIRYLDATALGYTPATTGTTSGQLALDGTNLYAVGSVGRDLTAVRLTTASTSSLAFATAWPRKGGNLAGVRRYRTATGEVAWPLGHQLIGSTVTSPDVPEILPTAFVSLSGDSLFVGGTMVNPIRPDRRDFLVMRIVRSTGLFGWADRLDYEGGDDVLANISSQGDIAYVVGTSKPVVGSTGNPLGLDAGVLEIIEPTGHSVYQALGTGSVLNDVEVFPLTSTMNHIIVAGSDVTEYTDDRSMGAWNVMITPVGGAGPSATTIYDLSMFMPGYVYFAGRQDVGSSVWLATAGLLPSSSTPGSMTTFIAEGSANGIVRGVSVSGTFFVTAHGMGAMPIAQHLHFGIDP